MTSRGPAVPLTQRDKDESSVGEVGEVAGELHEAAQTKLGVELQIQADKPGRPQQGSRASRNLEQKCRHSSLPVSWLPTPTQGSIIVAGRPGSMTFADRRLVSQATGWSVLFRKDPSAAREPEPASGIPGVARVGGEHSRVGIGCRATSYA